MDKTFDAKIKLDISKDADVIETLNKLRANNRINSEVTKAIKWYCRNSESKNLEEKSVTDTIKEIKDKVDFVYDECMKLTVLAKMCNIIGIADRCNNEVIANFLNERQLKMLIDKLGIKSEVFNSDKAIEKDKVADEVVEFICCYYQDILNEFKAHVSNKCVVQEVVQEDVSKIEKPVEIKPVEIKPVEIKPIEIKQVNEEKKEDFEIIDDRKLENMDDGLAEALKVLGMTV